MPASSHTLRKSSWSESIQQFWTLSASERQRAPLTLRCLDVGLLRPLSWFYAGLAGLRMALYRIGALRAQRLPCPVIVLGNVVVGGVGKTPAVMALVAHLQSQGWRPGVISRGYGRQSQGVLGIGPSGLGGAKSAADLGDEPWLIWEQSKIPVFVAKNRVDAGRALLAAYPDVDVLVSDDGLQHMALARDVQVVVFDERGTGNGRLLPAGMLREPWPLPPDRPVDVILRTGGDPSLTIAQTTVPQFLAARQLTGGLINGFGQEMALSYLALQSQANLAVTAIAAIAHPDRFFAMLQAAGVRLQQTQAMPDHADLSHWAPPINGGVGDNSTLEALVVCTHKDAVKLWAQHPQVWAVAMQLDVPAGFWMALNAALTAKRLSPRAAA